MEILIFLGIIIYSIISSSKKNKEAESSVDAPTLDDIFKEVVKTANQKNVPAPHNGGFGAYIKSVDQNYPKNASGSQARKKSKKQEVAPSRESLTRPTVHNEASHNCEDVNYDQMESLMGKEGSFGLASTPAVSYSAQPVKDFKMTRDDLLKSFIMSEVLQRYDINRIYSRIPAVKSDD